MRGILTRLCLASCCRGLDNAGKTTIVKKFNGEDIDTIEPTLGFNIKTMDYRGSRLPVFVVSFFASPVCFLVILGPQQLKSGRRISNS